MSPINKDGKFFPTPEQMIAAAEACGKFMENLWKKGSYAESMNDSERDNHIFLAGFNRGLAHAEKANESPAVELPEYTVSRSSIAMNYSNIYKLWQAVIKVEGIGIITGEGLKDSDAIADLIEKLRKNKVGNIKLVD